MKQIIVILSLCLIQINCGDNEPSATCTDGILNGTETKIDCGGDCPVCDREIFGLYNGLLRIRSEYSFDDILFESADANLSITSCNDDCIELTFQADGGSTKTKGTYVKSNGFYSMTLTPKYEIEGQVQSWEEDWEDGSGSFDFINNEISVSVIVSDEHSLGNTESVYFFEGSQN